MAAKRAFPLSRVYGLLEPGPVLLMGTQRGGRPNVMALSWHTMMEFEPPLVGCVFGDGYSAETLRRTRQCTLNVPTLEIARAVVRCGNLSARGTPDKFAAAGLTPVPATQVDAPMVAECHASLECRVADTRLRNRYGFVVLEVVAAWADSAAKNPRTLHHRGRGAFMVAGETIRLPSKMR